MPKRSPDRASRSALIVWLLLIAPASASAQANEPLEGSEFNIDLVTGPVLGSGRVTGLGGAYTALAAGIEAVGLNPAAYSVRGLWETDWFEWDVTGSLVPSMIKNSDFDNNGSSGFTYDSFIFGSVGLSFTFGAIGAGALLNLQSYDIGSSTELGLAIVDYGAAYALFEGQLVLGVSLRSAVLSITDRATQDSLVDFNGSGPAAGAMWKPKNRPFRIGAAARTEVASSGGDTLIAAGLTLPREVRLPWELQGGIAWQFGPRPLNRAWINPHDVNRSVKSAMLERRKARADEQLAREQLEARLSLAQQRTVPSWTTGARRDQPLDKQWWTTEVALRKEEEQVFREEVEQLEHAREREVKELPRRYLLLSGDVIMVGPTDNGVGLESFLSQTRQTSGADATVGFRFGAEGEPIENWMKMRVGTYFEPSRFAAVSYRIHGTAGFDLKLFTWDIFGLLDEFTLRFGASADVAERYLNLGVGLGLWH